MSKYATLIKPPPVDPTKSSIENVLELTPLDAIQPDMYTNTRPMWHPPGARGIYGGAAIAQCLSAAQATVPLNYTIHSMHCYFVLAGDADIPILYHVERVRDGKSFVTRTVQARQRGRPIFTTTMSFVREGSGGKKRVEHYNPLPQGVEVPGNGDDDDRSYNPGGGPFESRRIEVFNSKSKRPEEKKTRQWIRARGRISDEGGWQAHLSALAYMSDSYFIGTVSRVHNLLRFSSKESIRKAVESLRRNGTNEGDDKQVQKYLEEIARQEEEENKKAGTDHVKLGEEGGDIKQIGMMVSLDHTVYFHNPRAFRADEWMFTEMESPWAGDGRGLVFQKMWSKEGVLVASCVQEVSLDYYASAIYLANPGTQGVVRLQQDPEKSKL